MVLESLENTALGNQPQTREKFVDMHNLASLRPYHPEHTQSIMNNPPSLNYKEKVWADQTQVGWWTNQQKPPNKGKSSTRQFHWWILPDILRSINTNPSQIFFLFFFLMATPIVYGSSLLRDRIGATTVTYTTAVATPDPLTHCTGPGIESMAL